MIASIFLDFSLPNATTWFYLSSMLAVALFFKFSRFLSVRNWDVLTLFLLVPGLLLRQEASKPPAPEDERGNAQATAADAPSVPAPNERLVWFAYVWLLSGSAYFLARCLLDMALVRRPVLAPNMNLAGLAWLGAMLFICLVVVAVRRPTGPGDAMSKATPLALDKVQERAVAAVNLETGHSVTAAETRFWVERCLAILCHIAVIVALIMIGARHFQDAHAGMAAATFYVLLPYTALQVAQWQYVWPVALMLWAVFAYRRPTVAGLLLGLASGSAFFPAVTFPIWLSFYRQRGAGRFAAAYLLCCAATLGLGASILWWDGELSRGLQSALEYADWQPWSKPGAEGFWHGVNWPYRLPVFIGYLAFVIATFFWPAPKNLAHVISLSAASLIGVQFWFADKGGIYVLWYLPLLLLLVFRPNLSDRLAPMIASESDWLGRWRGRVLRALKQLIRLPEPATSFH